MFPSLPLEPYTIYSILSFKKTQYIVLELMKVHNSLQLRRPKAKEI
ncbi:hypothetical protein EMIT074MI3_11549 [Bacillus licheniformis]